MTALAGFLFAHIFVIAGAISLLTLFAAYHRGHDLFDLEQRDFSNDSQSTSPRETAH
jgi:hypothetical protein